MFKKGPSFERFTPLYNEKKVLKDFVQMRTFDGLSTSHTPFETHAIEPVIDHFITSKEKPTRSPF
jgi:hypothetical protein